VLFSWRAQQDLVFGIGMFAACAPRSAAHPAPQTGAGKRFAFTYPPFKSCYTSKQKEPPMVALFVWRAQQDLNLRPTGS
jgi:hypothetical protein